MPKPPKVPFGFKSEDETESNYGHGKPMTTSQLELYRSIKKKRRNSDELKTENTNQEFSDHELVEAKIYDKKDDKQGRIENVFRRWYDGWYWAFLTRYGRSHGLVFGYNESSEQDVIHEGVDEFHERYEIEIDGDFDEIMEKPINST